VSARRLTALGGLLACALLAGCASNPPTAEGYSPKKAAEVNAELGTRYLMRGELDTAKEKLERALDQNPRSASANNAYARLLVRLREPERAIEHFERAIELEPEIADYRNTYGIFLCSRGSFDAALAQFVAAAENPLYRTPEYAWDNAGLCALDAGEPARAEQYIRSALRVNPRFAPALLHMARAQLDQDQAQLADAYLARYHKFQRPRPESLWLGVQIARQLGDSARAASYGDDLLGRYPQSSQAALYLQSQQ